MKCRIYAYLLNEAFSQDFADLHHDGRASEDNQKYEWEDEIEVSTPVKAITEQKNETYLIQGTMANGEDFSYPVPNMRLVKIESQNAPVFYVGCSESILQELRIIDNKEETLIEIHLKDYEPFSNPIPGIYIGSKSFPKELIF
jgi:hypothetical protein